MGVPKKSLGQNFLIDESVSEAIAGAGSPELVDGVVEVGPGRGALTEKLLRIYDRVAAVELDESLINPLIERLGAPEGLTVIHGDAIKEDLKEIALEHVGRRYAIFGNIPYYLTSPLVMKIVNTTDAVFSVLMMQKEAAMRICAPECSRGVGAITLSVMYRFDSKILFDVPPSCFRPAPKVTSTVIRLDRLSEPRVKTKEPRAMIRLIRAAFSQRRKTAVNSISSVLKIDRDLCARAVADSGLEGVRAEKIPLAGYAAITDRLIDLGCTF
ncbi:MAG: 16S rRNA (adenine(1518)-N(6)/adenine(1519)-N(6))-dimethyltransferase RsmA [Oscillospiraceae bacterium]